MSFLPESLSACADNHLTVLIGWMIFSFYVLINQNSQDLHFEPQSVGDLESKQYAVNHYNALNNISIQLNTNRIQISIERKSFYYRPTRRRQKRLSDVKGVNKIDRHENLDFLCFKTKPSMTYCVNITEDGNEDVLNLKILKQNIQGHVLQTILKFNIGKADEIGVPHNGHAAVTVENKKPTFEKSNARQNPELQDENNFEQFYGSEQFSNNEDNDFSLQNSFTSGESRNVLSRTSEDQRKQSFSTLLKYFPPDLVLPNEAIYSTEDKSDEKLPKNGNKENIHQPRAGFYDTSGMKNDENRFDRNRYRKSEGVVDALYREKPDYEDFYFDDSQDQSKRHIVLEEKDAIIAFMGMGRNHIPTTRDQSVVYEHEHNVFKKSTVSAKTSTDKVNYRKSVDTIDDFMLLQNEQIEQEAKMLEEMKVRKSLKQALSLKYNKRNDGEVSEIMNQEKQFKLSTEREHTYYNELASKQLLKATMKLTDNKTSKIRGGKQYDRLNLNSSHGKVSNEDKEEEPKEIERKPFIWRNSYSGKNNKSKKYPEKSSSTLLEHSKNQSNTFPTNSSKSADFIEHIKHSCMELMKTPREEIEEAIKNSLFRNWIVNVQSPNPTSPNKSSAGTSVFDETKRYHTLEKVNEKPPIPASQTKEVGKGTFIKTKQGDSYVDRYDSKNKEEPYTNEVSTPLVVSEMKNTEKFVKVNSSYFMKSPKSFETFDNIYQVS